MTRYFIYIIVFLGWALGTTYAQDMHIKSQLDTNLIKIGEQAKLTVDVQYPKDADVIFPLMHDTVVEKVEILDILLDTLANQPDIEHYQIHYVLTSFDSGYYVVPSQILINTQTNDTIESQALMFAVATLVLDSTKQNTIFDIKAPIEAPWTLSEFWAEYYPYILGVLLFIALVIGGIWYWRKIQNKISEPVQKEIPKEAAHLIALRELENLKDKKLWQNDRVKLYYIELSDIVRNYLEHRFKIKTLEQTSQEIYDTVQRGNILNNEQLLQLKQILSTADMAKFAKAKPLANENDLALKNAFELIETTRVDEIIIESKEESVEPIEKIKRDELNTSSKEESHA